MVMCQTDAFFRVLAQKMRLLEVLDDPRFENMAGRLEHREPLLRHLEAAFRSQTVAHWLELLEGAVPIAPVNDLQAALREPQVLGASLLTAYEHEVFGTVHQVAGPVRPSSPVT